MEGNEHGRKSVLAARSPANKYEIMFREDTISDKEGPTEERMVTCFNAFDEIISEVSVYSQKVLKLIRDELYEAVFSSQYTTSAPSKSESKTSFIQRVPYFVLTNRAKDERDEKAEILLKQIKEQEDLIAEKNHELEACKSMIEDLNTTLSNKEDEINALRSDIDDLMNEKENILQEMAEKQEESHGIRLDLENTVKELRKELKESTKRANYLQTFKDNYDNLQEAFSDPSLFSQRPHDAREATNRNKIMQDIEIAKVLEGQLLTVRNACIEEFDAFIEEQQVEEVVSAGKRTRADTETLWYEDDTEIQLADEKIAEMQNRFKTTIADIERELQLLEVHKSSLEAHLSKIDEAEKRKKFALQLLQDDKETKKSNGEKSARFNSAERRQTPVGSAGKTRPDSSASSAGEASLQDISLLEFMTGVENVDPFAPQEHILSKYSVMMFYSCNQGRNFHEFKDAKFCNSCGEKTLICPHKFLQQQTIIQIPHNCTHVKLVRPVVRILQDQNPPFVITDSPMHDRETVQSMMTPYGEDGHALIQQQHLTTTYKRLWDDWCARTTVDRRIPRQVGEERIISIINQFYSTVLWQDEYAMEDEKIVTIIDCFYNFFNERYLINDISFLAAHDFISGVVRVAKENRYVQLFAQCMCGNIDPAAFRYFLLVADFIDLVDWKLVTDIVPFAEVLYPFMTDDDLEQFKMGYTSFSENKISKELVFQYYLYIILKYREPRFQEMEIKLLQHPGKRPGLMTDIEYSEGIDNICPLASETMRRRLFTESEMHVEDAQGSVQVMRLAQITGYLEVMQISEVIRENVSKKVNEFRSRTPHEIEVSDEEARSPDSVLVSMAGLKSFSEEAARRARSSQLRRIEEYTYDSD